MSDYFAPIDRLLKRLAQRGQRELRGPVLVAAVQEDLEGFGHVRYAMWGLTIEDMAQVARAILHRVADGNGDGHNEACPACQARITQAIQVLAILEQPHAPDRTHLH